MKTQQLKPSYAFSPSLLDAYQRMVDTKAEDYFYQDETGAWHMNWNESEETLHFSEEEVDALLKQEFLDTLNKVEKAPSEAASKGTCFNEIVDCLVLKRKPTYKGIVIKTIRSGEDLYDARVKKGRIEADEPEEFKLQDSLTDFAKIGTSFIYAALDGFEFFFDTTFCCEAAKYFANSIAQYYTKANIETSKGVVELHGYIDYLRENVVMDCKTTKQYQWGNYQKKWQRYTYPYTLIESGMMNDVNQFEFTIYVLKGGTSRTPLITGTQYKEVYTYDHEQAGMMLRQQCERLIDFLEENKDLITNTRVYGGE